MQCIKPEDVWHDFSSLNYRPRGALSTNNSYWKMKPSLSVSVWGGGGGMYLWTDLKRESVLSSAQGKTTTSTVVYFSFARPMRNIACFELWEIPQDLCDIPLPNQGSPSSSDGKGSASNAGDTSSIPGSGRYPREGNSNPFQYPCPENSMDRGAWWATVHGGRKESDTTEWLTHTHKPGQVWFTWMRKGGMGSHFKMQR